MRLKSGETAMRLVELTAPKVPLVYELYADAKRGKTSIFRKSIDVPPMNDLARAAIHWELVAAQGAPLVFAMPQTIEEQVDGLEDGDDWKLAIQWASSMCHFVASWFEHETPLAREPEQLFNEIKQYMGRSIGDGQFSTNARDAAHRVVSSFDPEFVNHANFPAFARELQNFIQREDLGFIMDDQMRQILDDGIDFAEGAEEES